MSDKPSAVVETAQRDLINNCEEDASGGFVVGHGESIAQAHPGHARGVAGQNPSGGDDFGDVDDVTPDEAQYDVDDAEAGADRENQIEQLRLRLQSAEGLVSVPAQDFDYNTLPSASAFASGSNTSAGHFEPFTGTIAEYVEHKSDASSVVDESFDGELWQEETLSDVTAPGLLFYVQGHPLVRSKSYPYLASESAHWALNDQDFDGAGPSFSGGGVADDESIGLTVSVSIASVNVPASSRSATYEKQLNPALESGMEGVCRRVEKQHLLRTHSLPDIRNFTAALSRALMNMDESQLIDYNHGSGLECGDASGTSSNANE